MADILAPRNLFERFRPAAAGAGLLSALQAYGGLQAWAARAHRPAQSLGRVGSLEVRLAQTAAEVRQAQKLRYRVFYQEGSAVPNPARLLARSATTCWCSTTPKATLRRLTGRR
jgi:L-ornithine Nalpha-acyltransferase